MAEGTVKSRVAGLVDRVFVPREVFLRTSGHVRFMQISVRQQKMAAAAASAVLLWGLFTTGSFVVQNFVLLHKDGEIERHKMAYFDLLAEVSEYHDQFARITADLEANQAFLLTMLERGDRPKSSVSEIRDRLKTSETERERVVMARDGLKDKLQRFESDLREIAERNISLQTQVRAMRDVLYTTETQRVQVAEARERLGRKLELVESQAASLAEAKRQLEMSLAELADEATKARAREETQRGIENALRSEIAALDRQLGQAGNQEQNLTRQIALLRDDLNAAHKQSSDLRNERDFLETRVAGLQQRMENYEASQLSLVERLRNQTELSTGALEKTLAMTGIDVEHIVANLEGGVAAASQGGPFVSDEQNGADAEGDNLEVSLSLLDLRLNRWQTLQEFMRSVPLSAPLEQYRITSSFGSRVDPLNKRKARHDGLDFGGPIRTSVYSTAPGKVVFAGWRGYYGRMVEIDHGFGIRTRYAHLKRILVKPGDQVPNRHKIALLGSSGRSTGPHVHYEVRVNGVAMNPAKFLTAGKYVFKE